MRSCEGKWCHLNVGSHYILIKLQRFSVKQKIILIWDWKWSVCVCISLEHDLKMVLEAWDENTWQVSACICKQWRPLIESPCNQKKLNSIGWGKSPSWFNMERKHNGIFKSNDSLKIDLYLCSVKEFTVLILYMSVEFFYNSLIFHMIIYNIIFNISEIFFQIWKFLFRKEWMITLWQC